MEVADVRLGCALRLVKGVAKFSRDADAVLGPLVNVEHDFAQAGALEPRQYGVDRGSLLGDEQNLAPPGDQRRDEVSDRLALASSWRTVNDQTAAIEHGVDSVALRRIRVEYREVMFGQVQRWRCALVRAKRFLGVRIARDGRDYVTVAQQLAGRLQILDHRQLGIREGADDHAVRNMKTRHLGVVRRPGQQLFDLVRVRASEVFGGGAEGTGKLVQQNGIEFVLVIKYKIEVVVPGPRGCNRQATQQHGSARIEEKLIPTCHAPGEVANANAPLLQEFLRLPVDDLDSANSVGARIDVVEEPGELDRSRSQETVKRSRVGRAEVERARAPILVVQQSVPPAEIG